MAKRWETVAFKYGCFHENIPTYFQTVSTSKKTEAQGLQSILGLSSAKL